MPARSIAALYSPVFRFRSLVAGGWARIICYIEGADTVWHKKGRSKKGQNLIEYAIVVVIIVTAMMAMGTYMFRSVQATQQVIQKGLID